MKPTAKIINFELFYTVQGEDNLNPLLYEQIIEQVDIAASEGCTAIIGLMLIDGFLYKDNEEFYSLLKDVQEYAMALGFTEFKIIAGMAEQYQEKLDQRGILFEIIYWDFYVNMIYQSYKGKPTAEWNPDADKFLFLTGVPSRHNRIKLLYMMYKRGVLENAIWSFFRPWTERDKLWCRLNLLVPDYFKFLDECDRSIDDLYRNAKDYSRLGGKAIQESKVHNTQWCQDPGWIDPAVFETTAYSVVSEGNVYEPGKDYRFLTEKIWRAIINKHPFIFAGDPEQFKYLESRGIVSFKKYTKFSMYAEILDEEPRFDLIILNIQRFLKTIRENKDQVQKDIDHNFSVFQDQVKLNQSILEELKRTYNIPQEEIDKWFNQKSFIHLTPVVNK